MTNQHTKTITVSPNTPIRQTKRRVLPLSSIAKHARLGLGGNLHNACPPHHPQHSKKHNREQQRWNERRTSGARAGHIRSDARRHSKQPNKSSGIYAKNKNSNKLYIPSRTKIDINRWGRESPRRPAQDTHQDRPQTQGPKRRKNTGVTKRMFAAATYLFRAKALGTHTTPLVLVSSRRPVECPRENRLRPGSRSSLSPPDRKGRRYHHKSKLLSQKPTKRPA